MRSSLRSPGDTVVSAISRKATTGFLSLSRSTVICDPDEIIRARWLASRTKSKRFSTLSIQSSTVTRAIGLSLHLWWNLCLNSPARYPLADGNSSIFVLVWPYPSVTRRLQDRRKADGTGFCRLGVTAQVAAQLIEGPQCSLTENPEPRTRSITHCARRV